VGKKRECEKEEFKVIYKNCGKGIHSIVSVVKRKYDRKLFIWKRPISDDPKHQESFRQEFRKAALWREFGASKVKVYWHPDGKSLLKTYIKGPTLEKILRKDRKFFHKTDDKKYKALRKLFKRLVRSGYYIRDLGSRNLVYDGERWHIIDSSYISPGYAASDARHEYKEELSNRWYKKISNKEIGPIRSFFDSI